MATAEEVTLARVPSPSLLTLCVNTTLGTSSQTLQKKDTSQMRIFLMQLSSFQKFPSSLRKIAKTELQT